MPQDEPEIEADDAEETEAEKVARRRRRKTSRIDVTIHPQDGVTVTHTRHLRAVELDGAMLASESLAHPNAPVWIQLAKVGSFAGHAAGPFELDARTFDDIVKNFKATANRRIPIDFEHASEVDASDGSIPHTGAPAQGWVVDLQNRQTDGLWGLVEWMEPARSYIREGKYRFISPAIRFRSRDRVSGEPVGARLTSAGLTNNPFLDGMAQLAARHDEDDDNPAQAGQAAGKPEVTEMDPVKMKELETSVSTLMSERTALLNEKAQMGLTLKDVTARAETAEGELKTLRDWRSEREALDLKAEVEVAYATYKDAKRLTDADKGAMLITLKAAPDAFRQLYPAVAPAQRHLMRTVAAGRSEGDRLQPAAGPRETMVTCADRLQKDNPKLSREDALVEAERTVRIGAARRSA